MQKSNLEKPFETINKVVAPPLIMGSNDTFKLHFTDTLLKKVQYLCNQFPSQEWSGVLFYKVEGELDNIKELKIEAFDLYPLDLGSSVYTEFEYTPDFAGYVANNPELMSAHMGLIHSHNNMGVFFSGRDALTLREQAPLYKTFLSVIVNNKLEIEAALSVDSNITTSKLSKVEYQGFNHNTITINDDKASVSTQQVALRFNPVIVKEIEQWNDKDFIDTVEQLRVNTEKHSFRKNTFTSNISIVNNTPIQGTIPFPSYIKDSESVRNIKELNAEEITTQFVCILATQNLFRSINTKSSFKENFRIAMMSVPKDIDTSLYETLMEDSVDTIFLYLGIDSDEDIYQILLNTVSTLESLHIQNSTGLELHVYNALSFVLSMYAEDLEDTPFENYPIEKEFTLS